MEDAGYPLTTSALSAWERDEYRPKSAAQVRALDATGRVVPRR